MKNNGNGGIVFGFLAFFQESPYPFAPILLALYGAESSPCSFATCFFLLLMPCFRLYTWQNPFSPLCCWSPHKFEPLHVGVERIMIHLMNTMHINNTSNNFHNNKCLDDKFALMVKKLKKMIIDIINKFFFFHICFCFVMFCSSDFFLIPK